MEINLPEVTLEMIGWLFLPSYKAVSSSFFIRLRCWGWAPIVASITFRFY